MKMCSENIYICKAQWVLGSAMHLAGIDWCGTVISDICLIYDDIVPQKPDI